MEEKPIILTELVSLKGFKYDYLEKFLKENGYNWSGFINNNVYGLSSFAAYSNFYFQKLTNICFTAHNAFLIWTGNDNNENFTSTCNNEFVKYIFFEINKFYVYTFIQEDILSKTLTKKLEKDLSKEWIQFLARENEYYHEGLVKLCVQRRISALNNLEATRRHIIEEKARLDKELDQCIESTNQEISSLDKISLWLEELN